MKDKTCMITGLKQWAKDHQFSLIAAVIFVTYVTIDRIYFLR